MGIEVSQRTGRRVLHGRNLGKGRRTFDVAACEPNFRHREHRMPPVAILRGVHMMPESISRWLAVVAG